MGEQERRHGRKPIAWTPEQIAAMAARYKAGATIRQVATRVGRSIGTVRAVLRDAGVIVRQHQPGRKPIPWTPEQIAAMVAEYQAGATIREVAARAGHGYSTVHGVLREAGVSIRARGRISSFATDKAPELVAAYCRGESLDTLRARYGISRQRVRAVLDEAGVDRRQRLLSWTPEQLAAVVTEYQEGASARDVAARHGCSPTAVQRALRQAGVTLRPGGFPPRSLTPVQIEDLVAGYRDGQSMGTLARGYRIGFVRVRALLIDAGVELRPHGGDRRRAQ